MVAVETAARAVTAEPVQPEGHIESAVLLFFCDNSPELLWTYLDDSGGVQGGFSSASMMDWFQGGYLRLEVPVSVPSRSSLTQGPRPRLSASKEGLRREREQCCNMVGLMA